MKYIIGFLVSVLFSCISYAQIVQSTNGNAKLSLRAAPSNGAKIITVVSPWKRLVPIYKKHDWMKVGDPANGKVGWINLKRYYKLITDTQKSMSQSIYITAETKPDQNGKYEIIVYKDGKKLDKKEAAVVLQQMIRRQKYIQKKFMVMQQQMNQMFMKTMQDFDDLNVLSPYLSITRDRVASPVIIFMRPMHSVAVKVKDNVQQQQQAVPAAQNGMKPTMQPTTSAPAMKNGMMPQQGTTSGMPAVPQNGVTPKPGDKPKKGS